MTYLTVNQAAEMLGVHQHTIRGMLTRLGAVDVKQGTAKKRCIRIPARALENYLAGCEIQAPEQARTLKTEWHLERRKA